MQNTRELAFEIPEGRKWDSSLNQENLHLIIRTVTKPTRQVEEWEVILRGRSSWA